MPTARARLARSPAHRRFPRPPAAAQSVDSFARRLTEASPPLPLAASDDGVDDDDDDAEYTDED